MSYLSRADKKGKPRTDAGYRVADNIAAIDFGTTSVSLAYTTKGDQGVKTLPLDPAKSTRVLNVVLLKKEARCSKKVAAFGANAKKKFVSLRSGEYASYIYFERIKMFMKREQAVHRQTLIESFSGEKYYLVEVIAFILQYLKDLLIDHLSLTATPLKTTDFDWVITVPAIWDARGKRMMREAAYLAGLLTESGGIKELTSIEESYSPSLLLAEVNPEKLLLTLEPESAAICNPLPLPDKVRPNKLSSTLETESAGIYNSPPLPDEDNCDKLSLALEPESAGIYSQENIAGQIEGNPSKAAISRPTKYMVIDVGGGTVDIATLSETKSGFIQVDNIPTGNACGGTQVNEAFSQLLQKLVRDPDYKKFKKLGEHSKQMAIINGILYDEFESQKTSFGQGSSEEIAVKLPNNFSTCYNKEIIAEVKIKGIEFEDDTLYINESVAESQLFGPVLKGIIDCTLEAIEKSGSIIDAFYLVGGFGGCNYVHEKVSAAIKKVKGSACKVIVPTDPHLAVATGAAMWRKRPEIIEARLSDATYGISKAIPFNPSEKHDDHYKYFDHEDKIDRCKDVFCVFLEEGEKVKTDEVISTTTRPMSKTTEQMSINIYSTSNTGVQYIVDKRGRSTVTKIGQIVLDVSNPDKVPEIKRKVDITMDFSGTEIQAKAKYRDRKEVKTVCDFLSAQ